MRKCKRENPAGAGVLPVGLDIKAISKGFWGNWF